MQPGTLVKLRDLGLRELWLQDWISADLGRLGLGPLSLIEQEQTQSGGGSLDILASNGDTYYSIEVQLGEVDASHGFRVFDYWARNRRRFPAYTHVAVLVAESAMGRYRVALEELAELTPLLVVELRCWQGGQEVVVVPELVIHNASVDVAGTPLAASTGEVRTAEDWLEYSTAEAWQFHLDFQSWVQANLGEIVIDYSPKSYIGVRVGRRVWAPLWLRTDGAMTYLPDPDLSRSEESPAFEYFHDLLAQQGLDLSWQTTYNAGANPLSIRLRREDLFSSEVQQLLRATYEAVRPSARRGRNSIPSSPVKSSPNNLTTSPMPRTAGSPTAPWIQSVQMNHRTRPNDPRPIDPFPHAESPRSEQPWKAVPVPGRSLVIT